MRRRRAALHRLLAGLLALWFAIVATEGAMAHACPMHDGPMPSAAMAPGTATAHAAHANHAAHGAAHGSAAAPDSHERGTSEGAHRCNCPDASCGASVMALATPRLSTHFGIAVADVRAILAPATAHHPVAVPYLTPFANGPPAAALA